MWSRPGGKEGAQVRARFLPILPCCSPAIALTPPLPACMCSCANCGLVTSPVWRKGWALVPTPPAAAGAGAGSSTAPAVPLLANLCNACGLRYKEGAVLERDPAMLTGRTGGAGGGCRGGGAAGGGPSAGAEAAGSGHAPPSGRGGGPSAGVKTAGSGRVPLSGVTETPAGSRRRPPAQPEVSTPAAAGGSEFAAGPSAAAAVTALGTGRRPTGEFPPEAVNGRHPASSSAAGGQPRKKPREESPPVKGRQPASAAATVPAATGSGAAPSGPTPSRRPTAAAVSPRTPPGGGARPSRIFATVSGRMPYSVARAPRKPSDLAPWPLHHLS